MRAGGNGTALEKDNEADKPHVRTKYTEIGEPLYGKNGEMVNNNH